MNENNQKDNYDLDIIKLWDEIEKEFNQDSNENFLFFQLDTLDNLINNQI